MDTLNSNPAEIVPVPVEDLAGSVPETNTPEVTLVPVVDLAGSVPGTGTLKASPSTGGLGAEAPAPAATAAPAAKAAPAATPAPAPGPAFKMELPKTTGQTVGGWNRFAGYNPNAAKNKPKEGRGGPGGRK
jgi:hypothetical protein